MDTVNAVCLKLPLQKYCMHHQKSVCDNAHLTTLVSIGFFINDFLLICDTQNGIIILICIYPMVCVIGPPIHVCKWFHFLLYIVCLHLSAYIL